MKKIEDLEKALGAPLPEDEIRTRADGQEYVGIGDVLLRLRDDVGPLGYDWTIERLEYRDPREDVREKVDKRTGAASGKEEGWTAFAYCLGKLTIRFVDKNECDCETVRMGAGTASSDMQPYPEMALENAIKAAESDALKRAVVGLGPRYGLALRFDAKRGDDRRELGLTEADPKTLAEEAAKEAALAKARAAAAGAKNKAQSAAAAPAGQGGQTQAPAAGKAPAAQTNQASGAKGAAQSPRTGSAPEAASNAAALAEKKAALDAALKTSGSKPDPRPAPLGAGGPATSSMVSSQSTASTGPATSSESASTTSASPAPQAAAAAPATSSAAASASASKATKDAAPADALPDRLQVIQACMRGEVPAWVTERLEVGVYPGDELGGQDLPPDPTEQDLRDAAWDAPGATASDLCKLGMAEPLAQPMIKALVEGASVRLGGDRKKVARLWKAFAVGGKDAPAYGYHARLFAWAVGHAARVGVPAG